MKQEIVVSKKNIYVLILLIMVSTVFYAILTFDIIDASMYKFLFAFFGVILLTLIFSIMNDLIYKIRLIKLIDAVLDEEKKRIHF